jgi:hypothetical protein
MRGRYNGLLHMTPSRHDRLAIALITLAGVLMSSSAMQPEHGRLILQSAIEVLDRRPGSDRDLAGWVLAAAVSAQDQAEAHKPVSVIPVPVFMGVSEGLVLSPRPVSPGFFAMSPRPGPLADGQWQLTSLPPPSVA